MDAMTDFDFIVVGSGATGSMAAKTLIDDGAKVLMLDGGFDDRSGDEIPAQSFVHLRRTDPEQYRYFLGDRFQSAAYEHVGAGAQLTPARKFILDGVADYLPVRAADFTPVESLAYGGLAAGWGLVCNVYSDAELALASLPCAAMRDAYQVVADRIGISGAAGDDAQPYTYGNLERIQAPIPLDPTVASVAARYPRVRDDLLAQGYRLGRPALALLTQPKDGRDGTQMRDMDFYCDEGRAAWRPRYVVESLERLPNFSRQAGVLITHFEERDDRVDVFVLDLNDRSRRQFSARRLVLACGALGSARIAMRSLPSQGVRLPLLCNHYNYAVCIVPRRMGRAMPERDTGLAQVAMFHDRSGDASDVAIATVFAYRSLLLFRLMREMPLNVRDARIVMQYLLSGFFIVGLDHPQASSTGKRLWLEPDASSPTHDALAIEYALTQDERHMHDLRERGFLRALRRLGAWTIKRVSQPLGASIHYAGTMPFADSNEPFTLCADGRLRGARNVYVADGSGFTFLPAKGLTLSLMANAHRVATCLTRS